MSKFYLVDITLHKKSNINNKWFQTKKKKTNILSSKSTFNFTSLANKLFTIIIKLSYMVKTQQIPKLIYQKSSFKSKSQIGKLFSFEHTDLNHYLNKYSRNCKNYIYPYNFSKYKIKIVDIFS